MAAEGISGPCWPAARQRMGAISHGIDLQTGRAALLFAERSRVSRRWIRLRALATLFVIRSVGRLGHVRFLPNRWREGPCGGG